jgi:hypothetical protein
MKHKIKVMFLSGLVLFFIVCMTLNAAPPVKRPVPPGHLIQLAILLDTSNSMDGLIEQAKSEIWRIVNELAEARKSGKTPRLEVALYEYGNNNLSANEGFLRMIIPFTTDLDFISENLFQLTTLGGEEFCGQVIYQSLRDLEWSSDPWDYKVIVIAGNEPFTQGRTHYAKACRSAADKDIIINTIFCGNYNEGINTGWKNGAALTDGTYLNIDQDLKVLDIAAPQDQKILELNQELNQTYLPYGKQGEAKKEAQEAQDSNAASINRDVEVQRTVAKASVMYSNTVWDLVDAVENEGVQILDKIEKDEYPPQMQKMNQAEKIKYIKDQMAKRKKIQQEIQELNKARNEYLVEENAKLKNTNTLGAAIIKLFRQQAIKKKFQFK